MRRRRCRRSAPPSYRLYVVVGYSSRHQRRVARRRAAGPNTENARHKQCQQRPEIRRWMFTPGVKWNRPAVTPVNSEWRERRRARRVSQPVAMPTHVPSVIRHAAATAVHTSQDRVNQRTWTTSSYERRRPPHVNHGGQPLLHQPLLNTTVAISPTNKQITPVPKKIVAQLPG